MSEFTELLAAAFPRDDRGDPFCGWCGTSRQADHALCRRCWFGLRSRERKDYLAKNLTNKAKWILANKPRVAVPS